MPHAHTAPQPPTALTRIAGGVCLCIGVAALATAHPDLHIDSAIWQPVSLLGSLGLLLSGLSLMALAHLRPAWSFVGGALLGGLGSLILFLHGIAPLLPEETLRSSWLLHLLSLSPPSALSFALGGLGLLFCGRPARRAWRPATIAALGSTTLALAMVSLLLQIVDSSGNNMVDSLARLPPLLASGLLCLGFGLMSHAAALSPLNPARRAPWLPISIGLGLATFTFAAWRALTAFDRVHLDHVLSTAAIAFRTHVVTQMRAEVDNMQRMANRWELGGGTARELWEADAASYIADRPGVLGVLWLAPPALEPRWGIPFAASAPWSRSLTTDQRVRASLTRARDECRPMLSPTFALDHGASGFIICVPLFVERRFDGLIASVVRIQEFLDSVFTDTVLQGFDVILTDGERALYGPHARNDKVDVAASVQVELSGLSWQLYVVPRPGDAATARSALPETTLVIGLLMAALVTLSVHLGQTAAFRARELEVVNNELERRVAARTAELERALVDLNRSNHDLEQFAYVASHDLQEPLRMVSSYVQLLARRYLGRIDTDADDFIRYAVDGAERMKRLINDLLAYSRLGTHSKPYHRVDCNQILKAARENLAIAIQEAAAEIESSHLPHVYGDETQLLQLFQNLLGNAVKFRGAAPPRIRFDATREGAHVHITVSDNGIGIDAQHAERIFDIFRRLHAQGEYAGTGIGLAVCRKIVERHGGKIWVTSQSGSGSMFHVTLPTGTDGATPRTHTDAPAVATTAHGDPQSKGSSA